MKENCMSSKSKGTKEKMGNGGTPFRFEFRFCKWEKLLKHIKKTQQVSLWMSHQNPLKEEQQRRMTTCQLDTTLSYFRLSNLIEVSITFFFPFSRGISVGYHLDKILIYFTLSNSVEYQLHVDFSIFPIGYQLDIKCISIGYDINLFQAG